MQYFGNVQTADEAKSLYHKLAKLYHPDAGGDGETMKTINAEYAAFMAALKTAATDGYKPQDDSGRPQYHSTWEKPERNGRNYDIHLEPKDITAKVRAFLKRNFPLWRFSVRVEDYKTICVSLLGGPFRAFRYGAEPANGYDQVFVNSCEVDSRLTAEAADVMRAAYDYLYTYHHDASDGQVDYFETNFFSHFYVGRYDKPYAYNIRPYTTTARRRRPKAETPKNANGWTIHARCYKQDGRVLIQFSDKPPDEVRDVLKRYHFAWSYHRMAWVRMADEAGITAARAVLREFETRYGMAA